MNHHVFKLVEMSIDDICCVVLQFIVEGRFNRDHESPLQNMCISKHLFRQADLEGTSFQEVPNSLFFIFRHLLTSSVIVIRIRYFVKKYPVLVTRSVVRKASFEID